MYGRRDLTKTIHELSLTWARISGMREDLVGICPIASCALYQAMIIIDSIYKSSYTPQIFWGKTKDNESHCWVESGGRVYDPTFKQFAELCPIYIGPPTEAHQWFLYEVREVKSLQDFLSWEDFQRPTQGRMNWFLHRIFHKDAKVMRVRNKNFTFRRP